MPRLNEKDYRKKIFLECKRKVEIYGPVKVEEIKAARDSWSNDLFQKPTDQLTTDELKRFWNWLRSDQPAPKSYASVKQIHLLRHLAFEYALYKHWYGDLTFVTKFGQQQNPQATKLAIQQQYKEFGYQSLQPRVKEAIWGTANSKVNRLLVEGKWRKSFKTETTFYYNSLTSDEASWLIKKFNAIKNTLQQNENFGISEQSINHN